MGADAYTGARVVRCRDAELKPGAGCPHDGCKGKLYDTKQPDEEGRIVGTVTISKSNDKSPEVGQARTLLQSIAGGETAGHEATIVLDQLLQNISP